MEKNNPNAVIRIASILIFFSLWQISSLYVEVDLLPGPNEVFNKIILDDLPDNTFWDDWNNGLSINDMASKVVKDTLWEDYYKEQLENQK